MAVNGTAIGDDHVTRSRRPNRRVCAPSGALHITLHLPEGRHHEQEWMNLFETACGPPAQAA
jgi:hypothetical protein